MNLATTMCVQDIKWTGQRSSNNGTSS